MDLQEESVEEVDLPPGLQLEIDTVLSNASMISLPNLIDHQSTASHSRHPPANGDALSVSSSSLDSLNMLLEKQRLRQLNHPHHQDFINVPQGLGIEQEKVKETNEIFLKYDPVSKRKVLNTYEIINELGHGQHGKVKLARDLLTKQLVAIKIVDRHEKKGQKFFRIKKSNSLTQNDKIKREIAIMKKCHYKHVVKLIEVLDDLKSRKIYLVLEYCAKGEVKWCPADQLETETRGPSPLSFQRTREILRGVVLGLEYLHYQGVIHRDIKPANLLISEDDTVKISDFGVSLAASGANSSDGSMESIDELELAKTAGTPAFFAPEICLGNDAFEKFNMSREDLFKGSSISFMIDIWALGVTLYCLLFGMLPFISDYELELFEKIVNDPVKFPPYETVKKNKMADVSCEEEYKMAIDIVKKLLEKNPFRRITISEIKKHPFVCWDFYHVQNIDEQHLNSKMDELKEFELNKEDQFKQISISKRELKNAVLGVGKKIKESVFNSLPLNRRFGKVDDTLSTQDNVKNSDNSSGHDGCSNSSFIVSEGSVMSNLGKLELKDSRDYDENKRKSNDSDNNISNNNNDSNDKNSNELLKEGSSTCNDNDINDNLDEMTDMKKEMSQKEMFEKELKKFDEEHDPKNIVNLPINSSFASLDSFYIDNYAMSKLEPNYGNNYHNNKRDLKAPSIFARPPPAGTPFQRNSPSRNSPLTGNFFKRSSSRLNFLNQGIQSTRNDRVPQNSKLFSQRSGKSSSDIAGKTKFCNDTIDQDTGSTDRGISQTTGKVFTSGGIKGSALPVTRDDKNQKKYQIKRGNFLSDLNHEDEDTSHSSETGSSDVSSSSSSVDSASEGSAAESLPFEFAVDSANASIVSMRDLAGLEQVRPFMQLQSTTQTSRKDSLNHSKHSGSDFGDDRSNSSDDSDELILTMGKGGHQRRQESSQTSDSSTRSSRRNTLSRFEISRDNELNHTVDSICSATQNSSATLTHSKFNLDSPRSSKSYGDSGQDTLAVPSAVLSPLAQSNVGSDEFIVERNQRSPFSFSMSSRDSERSLLPNIRNTPTTYVDDVSGTGHHTKELHDNSRNLLKTVLQSSKGDTGRRQSVPHLNRVSRNYDGGPQSEIQKTESNSARTKGRSPRSLSRRDHDANDSRSKSISIAIISKDHM